MCFLKSDCAKGAVHKGRHTILANYTQIHSSLNDETLDVFCFFQAHFLRIRTATANYEIIVRGERELLRTDF
jgi:hypothetical protein